MRNLAGAIAGIFGSLAAFESVAELDGSSRAALVVISQSVSRNESARQEKGSRKNNCDTHDGISFP